MNPTNQNNGLEALHFDNRFTQELPADPESENYRREVTGALYSHLKPTRVCQPTLISHSQEMAETLGLTPEDCRSETFLNTFSGNQLLSDMNPYATCYGGHQFGNWAGQLGDGRAINLGEVLNQKNERWALQLKGAGPTPYSRSADGLAVLRSSIREFLCSEAMFHLGVPTTRALSLITTGEMVLRDMFYDGHPKKEPGAIVCRVAPSFTRFGHFQILSSRGEITLLKQLMDYTLRTDFPHLGKPSKESYLAWFRDVSRLTTTMVVHWMRVGFVHGVMNTDNMSILGLTIDYGPYGWLENYDPNWTPNTTDAQGRRYRFSHQAQIAQWNLLQLAYAIYPLIEEKEELENILNHFSEDYEEKWQNMMAQKLGLGQFETQTDKNLITELLSILQLTETDMTLFYRNLSNVDVKGKTSNDMTNDSLIAPLLEAYYTPQNLTDAQKNTIANWIRQYHSRLKSEGLTNETRRKKMNAVNPKYVFRNYLAQLAIDKAEAGDHTMVSDLLDVLRKPYDVQRGKENYAKKRPDWARTRAGCSMLSCSS
ncbi:MAG: YdiU family protein [Nitrospirota bacterium]|nr:YdiU family protein [Nitrospirota bacterium]